VKIRVHSWLILAVAALPACGPAPSGTDEARDGSYDRIVSLAPSTTEVLFALGLGDRVVGVTRYCTYPPEAKEKAEIGGFLDPNFEAILRLQPDLAVVLEIHGETKDRLRELGMDVLAVEHRTLEGILASIELAGAACGVAERADDLLNEIRRGIDRVTQAVDGRPRPRVLLSAGRGYGEGRLQEVYAAGQGQWYDDLIELAGGANAFEDETIMFPALSGEGLVRLNPDVIVEMAPSLDDKGLTEADVIADWKGLDAIAAVRTGRIYVLTADYVTIPGPRVVRVLEDLARVFHPDAFEAAP
jgi:iron complex transport system substrate-binding protein